MKSFPGDEDDMELILDDHPSSVALEISTPTAETHSPSPQQTSWHKSHDSRRDSAHVLLLWPHKVPAEM